MNGAVGIDVGVDQGSERSKILFRHLIHPGRISQELLKQKRLDEDQTGLKEVQREHGQLLALMPIRGEFPMPPVQDKIGLPTFLLPISPRSGQQFAQKMELKDLKGGAGCKNIEKLI